MRLLLIAVMVLLSGCARLAQNQLAYDQAQQQAQADAQRAYSEGLRTQCRNVGFQPDTDPFRQCILQLHTNNQNRQSQMQSVILQEAIRQEHQALPSCAALPPGISGVYRSQGRCR